MKRYYNIADRVGYLNMSWKLSMGTSLLGSSLDGTVRGLTSCDFIERPLLLACMTTRMNGLFPRHFQGLINPAVINCQACPDDITSLSLSAVERVSGAQIWQSSWIQI